ncbi:MAG: acyl-CoA synthetase [Actinobacteria bacterium]|nr:acyl-CoA synthetase [Actinomycetota bacterium]
MYPANWAACTPDKPAVVIAETGESRTYEALDGASASLAQHFRKVGLGVGDNVAILMDNRPELLETAWAAQRSGLYYTPLNWHLTPGEMAYILDDCQARVLVVGADHADVAAGLLGERPHLHGVVVGADVPGSARYEDVLADMPSDPLPDETEGQDMIYTSGTTGKPKGGMRPLPPFHPADETDKLTRLFGWAGMGADTVYLSPGAPLYHAAPLRFSIMQGRLGGTTVVMQRFDPLAALASIERYAVTHSQWVPTMFVRLLRLSEEERTGFDLSSHTLAMHAAAPCPVEVKRQMMAWWGRIIHEYYGASEGGALSHIGPEDWLAHPGSVGRAVYGRFRILDDNGNELPPDEPGTVYYEKGLPIRYHNDEEKTRTAHGPNGWSTVGDLGYLDGDGYLYLVGRRANLIISGGVNIYPQEIEDVLTTHPAVADVAVIGVPNADFGQEVRAVVEPVDHGNAGPELADELIAYCRAQLAAFKCPRTVDFERELPRAPNGKLYKRLLMDRYWKGADAAG